MGFFDKHILRVLADGEPRDSQQVLGKVDFSHNTLRSHLGRPVDQALIIKKKTPSKGLGRPRFTYSLPPRLKRKLSLSDPFTEGASLSFSRLKHLCRFEKGGYCKKIKKTCKAQNCPQILKKE